VLRYTVKNSYQTISNKQLNPTDPSNVIESQKLPQLLRLVTPAAKSAAPPRVPSGVRNLSPRKFSEDLLGMGSTNRVISVPVMHIACDIISPDTGNEMEYVDMMKEPTLKPLWERGLGNECRRLFQGIWDSKGKNAHASSLN
jgi:hypothetical protein